MGGVRPRRGRVERKIDPPDPLEKVGEPLVCRRMTPRLASAKPSESGSMPATPATSSNALRSTLYMRSVPMFPEPMIATRSLVGGSDTGAAVVESRANLAARESDPRERAQESLDAPCATNSASCGRPAADRDALHRAAGGQVDVFIARRAVQDREPVGCDRSHPGPLVVASGVATPRTRSARP